MKNLGLVTLVCLLMGTAWAGDVGVGFMLGQPTGASAKKLLGDHAVDAAAGWGVLGGDFQIHGDWLWNKQDALYFQDNHALDLYFGLGARMKFADEVELGVRLPLGLSHWFNDRGTEVFGELAPILDLVPRTQWEGQLAVGLRFYFL